VFGKHRRVLLDTSVWIYHLQSHPEFGPAATAIITAVEQGRFIGLMSELSLMELTVRPLQQGRQDVADEYELLLDRFPNLELLPVTRDVVLEAAAVRARYRLRNPDALLVATGLLHGATAAATNDSAWGTVAGIETRLLSEMTLSGRP
jgi:uncharacterized protein